MAEVRRNLFTPHAAENTVSRMDRAGAKRPAATPEDTDRSTSEGSKRARKRVAVTATTGNEVRGDGRATCAAQLTGAACPRCQLTHLPSDTHLALQPDQSEIPPGAGLSIPPGAGLSTVTLRTHGDVHVQ